MLPSRARLSSRRAFRLSELIVVLGIMVILTGIALLVVVKVREAAAQLASSNNLKQIALATINCADTNNGKLPRPGDDPYPTKVGELDADGRPIRTGVGPPLFHIVPYVESSNLYSRSYSDEDGVNSARRLRGTPYKIYQAPDDPTMDPSGDSCSYAVNEMAFAPPAGKNYRRIPEDFPDGTSQTILYAEQYAHQWGTWGTGWTEPRLFRPYIGAADNRSNPSFKDPPFQDRPRVGRDIFDGERPQSFRSSGLLVVMGDATVHCVRKDLTAQLFYDACTPAGGDRMSSDW